MALCRKIKMFLKLNRLIFFFILVKLDEFNKKYNLQKIKKNGRTLPRIEPRHLLLSPQPLHYTTRLSVFKHGRLCQYCPFHLHRRETMDNEKAQRVIHHFTFESVFTEFMNKNIISAGNEVCEGYIFTGVCLSTKGGA